MNSNKLRFSLLFSFLFICTTVFGQNKDQAILLRGIQQLPLPDSTEVLSAFYTINEAPEVIAFAKLGDNLDAMISMIASSKLGKGKLILFGSPVYFQDKLLRDKSVVQLVRNTMDWAGRGKIGIFGNIDQAFSDLLKEKKEEVYQVKDFQIRKNTHTLFLMDDVRDSLQRVKLEAFVRGGGSLVFASPYPKIFKNRDKSKSFESDLIKINDVFTKAGLFNAYTLLVPTKANNRLYTDNIPAYLQLKTIFPLLFKEGKPGFSELEEQYGVRPAIGLMAAYNPLGSAVLEKAKVIFGVKDTLEIPTMEKPVDISTPQKKWAYNIARQLNEKKLGIEEHTVWKSPSSDLFPGKVPDNAERVNEKVAITVRVGTQGLLDPPPVFYRSHSTGLYIPAGEKVKVRIADQYLGLQLKAQIGMHKDDLMETDQLTRDGVDLTRVFELDKKTTEIFSPYGGLLMINIGDSVKLKTIHIEVEGAVKAPYFKLGETTEADWQNSIRNYPAPWAELATDKIVLTVPSYRIRQLAHPEKLMEFWNEVMDADADLAIISRERVHQERMVVDRQVAYGYMFTVPDRIVVPDDQSCEWMLDESILRSKGSWGHFHELGHRHQFWITDFDGLGEVTVNLYSMYVYDQVLKKGIYNHEAISSKEVVKERVKKYLSSFPTYEKWSEDPFTALCMYIQLIEKFGWGPIKEVNRTFRSVPQEGYSKSNQEKIDFWFVNISKATKTNLSRFFEIWKLPVSDKAKQEVVGYASWFPEELEAGK